MNRSEAKRLWEQRQKQEQENRDKEHTNKINRLSNTARAELESRSPFTANDKMYR